jgi:alpha-beta hydrolase superfamily lysophospholipase
MAEGSESRFKSHDGSERLLRSWHPAKPEAIVVILHGMKDHSGRYLEFAEFLAGKGIIVNIPDHRGHGPVSGKEDLGYFGGRDGWEDVVKDVDCLLNKIKEEAPSLPLYLLGHSMGAQIARHYVMKYPGTLGGLVLSGAMQQPPGTMLFGIILASLTGYFRGQKSTSRIIEWLSFGNNNNDFKPARTRLDWVCNDPDRVDDYIQSPFCGFDMTVGAYLGFFRSHLAVRRYEKKNLFPTDLPVLIYGGAMDPVSKKGEQLEKLYRAYGKAGITDLQLKLYPGGRHEVHNDLNRKEVYRDVADWILKRAKSCRR